MAGEMVGYANNWAGVRLQNYHTYWAIQRQLQPATGHPQAPNYNPGVWEEDVTHYASREAAEAVLSAELGDYIPPEA